MAAHRVMSCTNTSGTTAIQSTSCRTFASPPEYGEHHIAKGRGKNPHSPAHNLELLRCTRAHVPDGARLVLADWWTDATHTQPSMAALMASEFLVFSGEGDVYSEEEARGGLQESR